MTQSKMDRMKNLLERWSFAGAVLMMETTKFHKAIGCCRFDTDPPRLCTGFASINASIQKFTDETEDFLYE